VLDRSEIVNYLHRALGAKHCVMCPVNAPAIFYVTVVRVLLLFPPFFVVSRDGPDLERNESFALRCRCIYAAPDGHYTMKKFQMDASLIFPGRSYVTVFRLLLFPLGEHLRGRQGGHCYLMVAVLVRPLPHIRLGSIPVSPPLSPLLIFLLAE